MLIPNRHGSSNSYRYGFQGQEKDDELKGEGNSLNYTFRMHDPRVGRFFATDPLEQKYPHYTPYSFSGNKVIHAIELEGLEEYVVTTNTDKRLRHFKVRPDDNLSVISKVTGVAVNDIIKWNEKALNGNPDLIYPGQNLVLFDATGLSMAYFTKPKQSSLLEQTIVELATTNEHGPSIQSQANAVLLAEGGAGLAEVVINSPKIVKSIKEGIKQLKPNKAPVAAKAPEISKIEASISGSGPTAGVLEVSNNVKSFSQFKNYNPKNAVEFVFDPTTERFVVGKLKSPTSGLSPHQNLAKSINGNNNVVGGMFKRGSNGEIITNEMSGHYYKNWTPEIRAQFKSFLESQTGQAVKHTAGPTF